MCGLKESIITHIRWARDFFEEAKQASSDDKKARLMLASVQSLIAVTEIVKHYSDDKNAIVRLAESRIRHYGLLWDLRAQTFHRRVFPGISGPTEGMKYTFWGGGARLSTGHSSGGGASIFLGPNGPQVATSEGGSVKRNMGGSARDIMIDDGRLWDQDSNEWISLLEAINRFIDDLAIFIKEANSLLQKGLSLTEE